MSAITTFPPGTSFEPGENFTDLFGLMVSKVKDEVVQQKKTVKPQVKSVEININNYHQFATVDFSSEDSLVEMATQIKSSLDSGRPQAVMHTLEKFIVSILNLALDEILNQLQHSTTDTVDNIVVPFDITIQELDEILGNGNVLESSYEGFRTDSDFIALALKMKEVLEFREFVKSGIEYNENTKEYCEFLNEWASCVVNEPDSVAYIGSSVEEYKKLLFNGI